MDTNSDFIFFLPIFFFMFTPFFIFFALIIALIIRQKKNIQKAIATMRSFGDQHGLGASPLNYVYSGLLPGTIQGAVGGIDKDTQMAATFFYLIHVVSSGKSRREYRRTVVEVNIKPTKQHIYVNSKLNDMTEQMPSAKYVRYQAEGQFGKYFDIYTPAGKQVEALSIFAPDLMSHLMAEFGMNDIEILDNKLYVYEYDKLTTQASMEAFYAKATALAREVDSNTPRKLALMEAQGTPDTSAVTTMRREINPRTIGIFLLVIVIQIMTSTSGFLTEVSGSPIFTYIPIVIGTIVAVGIILQVVKNRRLTNQYQIDRQQFLSHVKESSTTLKG